jgi:hypothetical protein
VHLILQDVTDAPLIVFGCAPGRDFLSVSEDDQVRRVLTAVDRDPFVVSVATAVSIELAVIPFDGSVDTGVLPAVSVMRRAEYREI